ncbi:serine/threonine protein kinase [Aphanomyces astaci]|uniref:Serine/threonine protein kinase n=1 Tax=Aphanomyces astaci TaxID=112090 RepID=W4FNL4_APHAT|nr:serine/threonine protein kinase [Aphanomyces astaci]ETV69052.1 serine/threonine protein kinase [Aphanomyces astaci]RQM29221.1 hypothetical protein B5M09_013521 [Aphanomyces astaci]|eukprot:XP_009841511.1 serine/threonine protein kinase [Aphanomyces astaci]
MNTTAYFTQSRLAMATYGDVVLAHSTSPQDSTVTIKRSDIVCARRHESFQCPHHLTIKDMDVERLVLREVDVHGGHPHIVGLVDDFDEFGYAQLVLEYCPHSVAEWLARDHPTEAEVMRLFGHVVSAVTFLHALGIAHNDLTMSHLLLSTSNDVKLIDFASATLLTELSKSNDELDLGRLLVSLCSHDTWSRKLVACRDHIEVKLAVTWSSMVTPNQARQWMVLLHLLTKQEPMNELKSRNSNTLQARELYETTGSFSRAHRVKVGVEMS